VFVVLTPRLPRPPSAGGQVRLKSWAFVPFPAFLRWRRAQIVAQIIARRLVTFRPNVSYRN